MDKQEQIEKMAQQGRDELIAGNYQGKNDIERLCKALHRIGYIDGADFVEWLKSRVITNKVYPHLAVALLSNDTREELAEFIDTALQEYLKGECV